MPSSGNHLQDRLEAEEDALRAREARKSKQDREPEGDE